MLIVSETRYVPTAVNMMVLQGKEGAFFYLHRSLYDQCVILRDQYLTLLPSFYKLMGMESEHPAVCDEFMKLAPEPIDILGPFLSLVSDCEELSNIEDMCGALSAMSMTVDFRKMFKVPASVRQSIKFSLNVREEYKVQWDRFFLETPTLDQVSYSRDTGVGTSAVGEPAYMREDSEEEEVTYTGANYSMEDLLSRLDASPASDEGPEANEEQAEEVSTVKSGFALLRGVK